MFTPLLYLCGLLFVSVNGVSAPLTLTSDNIDEIVAEMTLEEKATLCVGGYGDYPVQGAAGFTRPIPRLGIPATTLADGPAGLRINPLREGTEDTFYCTGFPVGTLLASSWDVNLVKEVTSAIGNEVLEYGVDVLLAPGTNIHRNPLCGRNFEYFSEDPVLSGNMAAAYINGVQSNNVGTSIKHFAANNQETNRGNNDARISTRALREIYLKNFEIAVRKSLPWTVMSSYNRINGKYTQQSGDLLTKVLREDWGYNGIVMTDWGSKEATADAAAAGNDLMEPGNDTEIARLVEAVKSGYLSEEVLDRNVRNILNYIVKTPAFKQYQYSNKPDLSKHAEIARRAACESIVLLRNENATLPLKADSKIALYGIGALDFVAGGTGSGNVNKAYVVNMVDGLKNAGYKLDENLLSYYQSYIDFDKATKKMYRNDNNPGWNGFFSQKYSEIPVDQAAVKVQAGNNDAAVIVLGRNAGEGSDRALEGDFELSDTERDLVSNVSNAFHREGKKVIVVLNIGGVIETASWKNLVDAIVLPWSPGQEGANAVGDVISGKVNPSGRLPMTFPLAYFDNISSLNFPFDKAGAGDGLMTPVLGRGRMSSPQKNVDYSEYEEGIWVGYRYFDTKGKAVSYPFGFGLSYTSFKYDKASVRSTKDGIVASVRVTNTGKVAGKEAVGLYVSAPEAGLEKPAKELKSFAKTSLLQPGESEILTFTVSRYELSSFNEDANRWECAAGQYTVHFGADVSDIKAYYSCRIAKSETFAVSDAYLKR